VTTRTKAVVAILVAVYLAGLGMLVGTLIERMRFDQQRAHVLDRYEQALREWHAFRMALERNAEGQR